ncbi:MAG: hypothetical protein ABI140_04340 [Jatrophihabitantaceae bacterium]
MTRPRFGIHRGLQLAAAGALVLAAVSGCAHQPHQQPPAPATGAGHLQQPLTRPAATPTTAGAGATETARSFVAAICSYDWRSPVSYGQNLNAVLRRYATGSFAAARSWSPGRIAAAQRALVTDQAAATCAGITGGIDGDAPAPVGTVAVRLSVQVTSQARDAPASAAQQQFHLIMRYGSGRWRVANGQW